MRHLLAVAEMNKLPTLEDIVAGSRSNESSGAGSHGGGRSGGGGSISSHRVSAAGVGGSSISSHRGSGAGVGGSLTPRQVAAVGALSGVIPRLSRAGNEAGQVEAQFSLHPFGGLTLPPDCPKIHS